jgi:hypothetical protein
MSERFQDGHLDNVVGFRVASHPGPDETEQRREMRFEQIVE